MKIVIAPDSYKESLSALEVATAIERGFREIFPEAVYVKLPVADGGEGTVEAMIAATQGSIVHVPVTGPLGERVEDSFLIEGAELQNNQRQLLIEPARAGNAFEQLARLGTVCVAGLAGQQRTRLPVHPGAVLAAFGAHGVHGLGHGLPLAGAQCGTHLPAQQIVDRKSVV